ncbi:MAG: FAD-dependent oxidoreductase [Deltaproteobacteria bacterium]|nr:FAD-dependent oxidoreductase [Deltaproteobacteria bacterium]
MEERDAVVGEAEVLERLARNLPAPVRLILFVREGAAGCGEQRRLLEAVAQLSDRLTLEVHDLDAEPEAASRYGVDKVPATAVVGTRDHGIRFYGLTAGHEFSSLLEALLVVSSGRSGLGPELEAWIGRIDRPTRLEVLVTLACPYCPRMVHLAHQLAVANDHVRAEMVDAGAFPEVADTYGVGSVPLTVVNGRRAFEGALPPADAVLEILKVAAPEAYEEVDAEVRSAAGLRRARPVEPGHLYDAVIVGAGPAAMAAAVYAVRKGLDVALVGDRLGGQIADTAAIENWLGAATVGGFDLAVLFRAHVENYSVAERLRTRVAGVERQEQEFVVRTEEGEEVRGRTVIYCAGKQYRRLLVPGEERFLGRGVAFCATCDAPLYHGKAVAVVGGGNSAFTAARDLVHYAREIHLINVVADWQADPVLVDEVSRHPHVVLHPATRVVEVLGEGKLSGVRVEPAGGGPSTDLLVDGVFLEIGLVPNSGPVADLVRRNELGEVVVHRDQSTDVPGFFAAGDVTDEPEKQIVVAEGAGAKAGLAAYAYLAAKGTVSTASGW